MGGFLVEEKDSRIKAHNNRSRYTVENAGEKNQSQTLRSCSTSSVCVVSSWRETRLRINILMIC